MPPGDPRGRRSFDGWTLDLAFRTLGAYKVKGAGVRGGRHTDRRLSGRFSLGPYKTPADNRAFASNPPREDASAEAEHSFSPAALPPAAGEGRAAGEKEC